MVAQIAAREIIHDQVKIFPILESVVHIDYVGVVKLREYLPLVHNRLETALSKDPCLGHLFHRVVLLGLLPLYLPHLAEASLANAVEVVEVAFRES